jgi:hypothetical protein
MKVYKYVAENQPNIVTEVYCMNDPDDAFGLLSLDWGGDPVDLGGAPPGKTLSPIAPAHRALYGRGLLRLCVDNIYIRILASRETSESRDAVLALGREITRQRENRPEPKILQVFPATIGSGWALRNDRIGFFRSHMVLNSLYYLSHQNILNLDQSAEATTAPYENTSGTQEPKRVQVVVVNYPEQGGARKALERFREAYLPDQHVDDSVDSNAQIEGYHNVEDGWVGYRIGRNVLVLVFSCPDRESARIIINGMQLSALAGE